MERVLIVRRPPTVGGASVTDVDLGFAYNAIVNTLDDANLDNVYEVAVPQAGNPVANQLLDRVFTAGPTVWRATW